MLGSGTRAYEDSSSAPSRPCRPSLSLDEWEDIADADGLRLRKRKVHKTNRSEPVHQVQHSEEEIPREARAEAHQAIPEDLPEPERLKMLLDHVCASEKRRVSNSRKRDNLLAALEDLPVEVERLVARAHIHMHKPRKSRTSAAMLLQQRKEWLRSVIAKHERELSEWQALPETAYVDSSQERPSEQVSVRNAPALDAVDSGDDVSVEASGRTLSRELEAARARRELQAEALASAAQKAEAVHNEAQRMSSRMSSTLQARDFSGLPQASASPGGLAEGFLQHQKAEHACERTSDR